MNLRVDRTSDVPLHEQIAAQFVFLIATQQLKAGTFLPSARALARRLGVHRNTIVRAYNDDTLRLIVVRKAGARLVVRPSEPKTAPDARDLDALLGAAILEARRRGYTLRQVHDRLVRRLRVASPERLLGIAQDAGMRRLISSELAGLGYPTASCSLEDIRSDPRRALGALVVCAPAYVRELRSLLGAEQPITGITYSSANPSLEAIAALSQPSHIALVSVSAYVLEVARALFAPAVGRRHTLQSYLAAGKQVNVPRTAEVLVCDTLTYPVVRSRRRGATALVYRLLADSCVEEIKEAMRGGSQASRRTKTR